jgi:hypothetical protein
MAGIIPDGIEEEVEYSPTDSGNPIGEINIDGDLIAMIG